MYVVHLQVNCAHFMANSVLQCPADLPYDDCALCALSRTEDSFAEIGHQMKFIAVLVHY